MMKGPLTTEGMTIGAATTFQDRFANPGIGVSFTGTDIPW